VLPYLSVALRKEYTTLGGRAEIVRTIRSYNIVLPVVHEMYAGRYHFDSLEPVAGRPAHHVDAEFHAGRHVEKKRRGAVHVQSHRAVLVHGRRSRGNEQNDRPAGRKRRSPRTGASFTDCRSAAQTFHVGLLARTYCRTHTNVSRWMLRDFKFETQRYGQQIILLSQTSSTATAYNLRGRYH